MPSASKRSRQHEPPLESSRRAKVWLEIASALRRGPSFAEPVADYYEDRARSELVLDNLQQDRPRRFTLYSRSPVELILALLAAALACHLTLKIAAATVEPVNLPGAWVAEFFNSDNTEVVPSRTRTWRGVLWTADEPVLLRRSAIVQPDQIPLLQRQVVWMHAYTCFASESAVSAEFEIFSQQPARLFLGETLLLEAPGGKSPYLVSARIERGAHLLRVESKSSPADHLLSLRAAINGGPMSADFSGFLSPPVKPPSRLPIDWSRVCDLGADA